MSKLTDRIKNGWDAFKNDVDPNVLYREAEVAYSSSFRPDRFHFNYGIDRTLINSIYNRIALDVTSCSIEEAVLDENGRYTGTLNTSLNKALTLSANLDQTGKDLIRDIVMSMFDDGSVAVVPVYTDINPNTNSYIDIYTLRTGQILEWYPEYVKIRIYNERTGRKDDILMKKSSVAIIENPFYSVMNEKNSTLQRLIRKLNLLDRVDENNSSGKLDLIIQLPYAIKSDMRRQQAELRRKEIEQQLIGSKYGIAYTDGTEKITQLNRPLENTLMQQIEYLTSMLYGQLGLTDEIMNGKASEECMMNYYSRTIEPILAAICDEMTRKFLSAEDIESGIAIYYFRDPFKLTTVMNVANIADTFTRNEIMSTNEIRGIIGMKPSDQPGADELRNKNLNQESGSTPTPTSEDEMPEGAIDASTVLGE